MTRWLLNIFAALSLVLCAGTLVLWTQSKASTLSPLLNVNGTNTLQRYTFSNAKSRLSFGGNLWKWSDPTPSEPISVVWLEPTAEPSPTWLFGISPRHDGLQFLGAEIVYQKFESKGPGGSSSYRYATVVLPHAYVALGFLLLPLLVVRRFLRLREEAAEGGARCRHCGYDLRAHGPGDKCPECSANVRDARRGDPMLSHG